MGVGKIVGRACLPADSFVGGGKQECLPYNDGTTWTGQQDNGTTGQQDYKNRES
jgi:hypothetical protein